MGKPVLGFVFLSPVSRQRLSLSQLMDRPRRVLTVIMASVIVVFMWATGWDAVSAKWVGIGICGTDDALLSSRGCGRKIIATEEVKVLQKEAVSA